MLTKLVKILFGILFMAISALAQEGKYTNSLGMEFVLIPSGSFVMGGDKNFEEAYDNELPKHKVTISKPFYLGAYEVTQTQWIAVMGANPSHFKERDNPVDSVSWEDVQKFISKLNDKEKTIKYRLPTEAEWEYAARAGDVRTYTFGDDATAFKEYSWLKQNSRAKSHPIGEKLPNKWGLYDMCGNVFEWVQDLYADNYNINQNAVDPKGSEYGSNRVFRGGSWYLMAKEARVALRSFFPYDEKRADLGFRVAITIK
jgi:formylglycine-generating enzyme required for sulfatase activity